MFSIAEARSFDQGQLASAATYPDALITAAEARIRQAFETICRVAFVEIADYAWTTDGNGTNALRLPSAMCNPYRERPTRDVVVASLTIDGTAVDAATIAAYPSKIVLRSGVFADGHRNVVATYTYGWPAVPGEIKRAALLACVLQLVASDIPMSADSLSAGGASWSMIAGSAPDRWTNSPDVNAVLKRYIEALPGIGIS